jgi:hypothetical protein
MERFWMVYYNEDTTGVRYRSKLEASLVARKLAAEIPETNAIVLETIENWVTPAVPPSEEGFDPEVIGCTI